MVFGMSLATFTLIHVIISLIGIGSGLIVLFGMFGGKRLDGMTALFLVTTVLTSLTVAPRLQSEYSLPMVR